MKRYLFISLVTLFACNSEIIEDENLVENLMGTKPDQFGEIIQNKEKYQVQVIYTRIERDSLNQPSFKSFYFNHDPEKYFYPASTVKLPASILSLEKLRALDIRGLTQNTFMLTDSAWSGQSSVKFDSSSKSGRPSIGHYIKKILLVSDNDAHNRLYEFLGQREFNEKMWNKGFKNTRMTHRLSIFLDQEENARTNPIRFVSPEDSIIYEQPMVYNDRFIQSDEPIFLGEAHISGDSLINAPMNFQFKNNFPLQEQHKLIQALFFPEQFPIFSINPEDRKFIWKYMSMLPSETTYPDYRDHDDYYVKFFLYGDGKSEIPDHVRVFNKVGQAYGYLIDNAYIVDFENGVEFLLSAVIYVNENQTLNDGNYEYDERGFPFLANLGRLVYEYELNNPHDTKPDLFHLKLKYDN